MVDITGELITGTEEGLLLYNGGTVCDDSFNDNAANAICREMGFDRAQNWNSHTTWTIQSRYEIVLDDVSCDEDGTWDTCTFVETHNCGHTGITHADWASAMLALFMASCKIQVPKATTAIHPRRATT